MAGKRNGQARSTTASPVKKRGKSARNQQVKPEQVEPEQVEPEQVEPKPIDPKILEDLEESLRRPTETEAEPNHSAFAPVAQAHLGNADEHEEMSEETPDEALHDAPENQEQTHTLQPHVHELDTQGQSSDNEAPDAVMHEFSHPPPQAANFPLPQSQINPQPPVHALPPSRLSNERHTSAHRQASTSAASTVHTTIQHDNNEAIQFVFNADLLVLSPESLSQLMERWIESRRIGRNGAGRSNAGEGTEARKRKREDRDSVGGDEGDNDEDGDDEGGRAKKARTQASNAEGVNGNDGPENDDITEEEEVPPHHQPHHSIMRPRYFTRGYQANPQELPSLRPTLVHKGRKAPIGSRTRNPSTATTVSVPGDPLDAPGRLIEAVEKVPRRESGMSALTEEEKGEGAE